MSKIVTLKPHMSEKAYALSKESRTYVFAVPSEANKLSVAEAVNVQFKVDAIKINLTNVKGKPKRTVRRGGRALQGQRNTFKRAYVTLKEGDSLPFFEEVEKAAEDEKKIDEKTKKEVEKLQTEKPIEKEVKPKSRLRQVFSHSPRQTQNRGGEK